MAEETQEVTTTSEETQETVDVEAQPESQDSKDQHIDWKEVAEQERSRREKAENALAKDRYKAKEEKTEEPQEVSQGLTLEQVEALIRQNQDSTRKELFSARIREEATRLTNNADEAQAVIEIHRNRVFPDDMPIEKQIQEAYFIAHGPNILARNSELKRSLAGKAGVETGSAENAHKDPPQVGEPTLSPQDKAELARLGFKWDGKVYFKELNGGQRLVRDWKTGKSYVQ